MKMLSGKLRGGLFALFAAITLLVLTATLQAPAWEVGEAPPSAPGVPGSVNYVEGQVSTGDDLLTSHSVGFVTLQPDQSLQTAKGKAEILLTPGVFVRLGNNSSVKMISPDLDHTAIAVEQGKAMVEVDQIQEENDLRVAMQGANTRLLKTGLYEFDAQRHQVLVFEGEAEVDKNGQKVKVKGDHATDIAAAKLKAVKFDKNSYKGDLYRFSRLRSSYLAGANAQAPNVYVADGGPYGPGWWWNPWFGGYTFSPSIGVYYSPFGWSFYGAPYYSTYWGWYGGGVPYRVPYGGWPYRPGPHPGGWPYHPGPHPGGVPGGVGPRPGPGPGVGPRVLPGPGTIHGPGGFGGGVGVHR